MGNLRSIQPKGRAAEPDARPVAQSYLEMEEKTRREAETARGRSGHSAEKKEVER